MSTQLMTSLLLYFCHLEFYEVAEPGLPVEAADLPPCCRCLDGFGPGLSLLSHKAFWAAQRTGLGRLQQHL